MVQEPICKASIESFDRFLGCTGASSFAGNQLLSDDYQTFEIANVFNYCLFTQ